MKFKKINWIKILFWVSAIALFVLWFNGLLAPLTKYLDSKDLSFSVGKMSFSPLSIIESFLVLIASLWFFGKILSVTEKALRRSRSISSSSRAITVKMLNIASYIVATLLTLYVLGLDITAITIFGGAIGIGVGFGLQKIASNFISGLILLFERSVREGDMIELSGDGGVGIVRRIFARYTIIEAFDGREIMVPNEDFITSRVISSTFSDNSGRIELSIGVSYDSDIHQVKDIILSCALAHKACSKKKPPECYLKEFADSSVRFTLFMWVDNVLDGRLEPTSEVLFDIWDKFKANNIKIPYPQMDVHLKKAPDATV